MQLSTPMRILGGTIGLGAMLTAPALAAAPGTMDVTVTIPRLKVAEYHKPYVAIWIEKEGAKARTVAVWYDHDMKANEGTKWQIGRAHVCTPVTNAHLVCRLLLEKK